jgi:hypothetical protein
MRQKVKPHPAFSLADQTCVHAVLADFGNGGLAQLIIGNHTRHTGLIAKAGKANRNIRFCPANRHV